MTGERQQRQSAHDAGCFSAGCSHKNTASEDKESDIDASVTDKPEDTEELSEAEIYERGYDLPIDSAEQKEAEKGKR